MFWCVLCLHLNFAQNLQKPLKIKMILHVILIIVVDRTGYLNFALLKIFKTLMIKIEVFFISFCGGQKLFLMFLCILKEGRNLRWEYGWAQWNELYCIISFIYEEFHNITLEFSKQILTLINKLIVNKFVVVIMPLCIREKEISTINYVLLALLLTIYPVFVICRPAFFRTLFSLKFLYCFSFSCSTTYI